MTSAPPCPIPHDPSAEMHEEEASGKPPPRRAQPHIVRLQTESLLWKKDRLEQVRRAAEAALNFLARHEKLSENSAEKGDEKPSQQPFIVSILCTDERRMRALNRRFRNKDTACDSLAFPAATKNDWQHDEQNKDGMRGFLGDIALGYQGLQRAIEQHHLDALAHCAHMTIHGVLHLKNFIHDTDEERATMEAAEETILAQLGFADLSSVDKISDKDSVASPLPALP